MMNKKEIHTTLTTIFQEVFADDQMEIFDAMTATTVEGWDSVMHINLIFSCEESFEIKFTLKEIAELKNVGELKAIIGSKLG